MVGTRTEVVLPVSSLDFQLSLAILSDETSETLRWALIGKEFKTNRKGGKRATMASCEQNGRSFEEGALYLVEDRLETFQVANWPFDSGSCTPLKMAEAGFYFCGTAQTPDWVRCVVCHQDMEGWEEEDDPREEHKRHSPNCAYLKLKDPYKITFGEMLDLEKSACENYIKSEAEFLNQDLQSSVAEMREIVKEAIKKRKADS